MIRKQWMCALLGLNPLSRWMYFVLVLLATASLTSCRGDIDAAEKGKNMGNDAKSLEKSSQEAMPKVTYAETVDQNGKKVWVLTLGKSTYRIPEAYRPTLGDRGAWLYLHWPSGLPSGEISQSQWSGSDQLNVRIDLPTISRTAEAERARREQMYPGYTTRPFAQFPDLLQLYDAKGNPTPSFLTNRKDVRMPNGEPFFLDGLRTDDPEWTCRTFIGLPDGNELIVDFRVKHLASWHQIFPKVLQLIDSMKEQ